MNRENVRGTQLKSLSQDQKFQAREGSCISDTDTRKLQRGLDLGISSRTQEMRNRKVVIVALLFFLFMFAFASSIFSVDDRAGSKFREFSDSVDLKARGLVNKNLKTDEALKTLRQNQVMDEHKALQDRGLELQPDDLLEDRSEMIDSRVYDGSDLVYSEIYGSTKVYDTHMNPEDRVEAKLRQLKMVEEYDYQQKLAYIEAFMENAYEQGYQVQLNEELEVVSVKRVDPRGPYRGSASLVKLLEGE